MNMNKTFGVRQLGIFIPTVILEEDCFYYKNKRYSWGDILAIKRGDDAFSQFLRYPSATILLSDGVILRIPTTLKDKYADDTYNFTLFHSDSAYQYVVGVLETNSDITDNDWLNYLFSCNYIMLYRGLICISVVFAFTVIFAVNLLKLSLDITLISLLILQLLCMFSGIYMMARRHLTESKLIKKLSKRSL